MPKTPTFSSERVSLELHCDSSLSSLAVSWNQLGEAQLWQRGLGRLWSAIRMWQEARVCCWPAAPSTQLLSMFCHVCSSPWSQEWTPSLLSPGPASAQHTAMLLPAQLLSGELPRKGEALSKHRAAVWSNPTDDMWEAASSYSPQKSASVSFDLPALSFQNIKITNIYQQD